MTYPIGYGILVLIMNNYIKELVSKKTNQYPHQKQFLQTLEEVVESIGSYLDSIPNPEKYYPVLDSLLEPERVISFKVRWLDDQGQVRINRGWRVQFNGARGPYKGGLRFDPSVNEDILKFLGFEQTFKNALTGVALGGGKGGSDINPKELSRAELERFTLAFMIELKRYIGDKIDIPAGDIGVGAEQIGLMYGAYRKLGGEFSGVLTGKGLDFGGLDGRTQATGFGVVYILEAMLSHRQDSLEGKKVVISGSGNVSTHAAQKAVEKGAMVLTLSDRKGYIFKEPGFTLADIELIKAGKVARKPLSEINSKIEDSVYQEGKPWSIKADIALPCATQNEVDGADAKVLVENAISYVVEGANMPLTPEAIELINNGSIGYIPGKAANAGGVAMSGVEMNQNSQFIPYKFDEVDSQLQSIMQNIHELCVKYGAKDGVVDYAYGANVAGFVKVAESMLAQGL